MVFRLKEKENHPGCVRSVAARNFLDDAATPPCGDARRGLRLDFNSFTPAAPVNRWCRFIRYRPRLPARFNFPRSTYFSPIALARAEDTPDGEADRIHIAAVASPTRDHLIPDGDTPEPGKFELICRTSMIILRRDILTWVEVELLSFPPP